MASCTATVTFLAVTTTVLLLVSAQQKSGSCPPPTGVGICAITCRADLHCPGMEKCCRTSCRGTVCTQSVTTSTAVQRQKPGSCPSTPSGPWVCSSTCSSDADCRRKTYKCCKNRCGAMVCQQPQQ